MRNRLTGMVLGAAVLGGCASAPRAGGEAGAVVENYGRAFDAARTVLRDGGFVLERVDARAGVITTQPKTTAGIATPWHGEQSSLAQDVEDLLQRQQRVARVTFAARGGAGDMLLVDSPAEMSVHVVVQRLQVPGRKLEPEAMRQHSYYLDPDLAERRMQPSYAVAWKEDSRLAERIAAEVTRRSAAAPEWVKGTPQAR